MTPLVAEIATQVDRLVWSVNDLASFVPDPIVAAVIASSDEEMSRSISHFAVFWLEGPLELPLAEQRFPYDPPGRVSGHFTSLSVAGLLEETSAGWEPTLGFVPTLERVVSARREASAALWKSDLLTCITLVERVTSSIGSDHPVAHRHAALSASDEPPLRLFDRMTTLRYLRQHDHVESWSSHGMRADEMVALTGLVSGDAPEIPDSLVDSGLVDASGSVTETGETLWREIESETNRRNAETWSTLDDEEQYRLLHALTELPGDGR